MVIRRNTRRRLALVVASALVFAGLGAGVARAQFTPGAAAVGDPFFPNAGNGGYEAVNYDLRLNYTPRGNRLRARALITANATQDLSSFSFDYRGPKVRSVKVDGEAAGFSRSNKKLFVAPAAGITDGAGFTVAVAYRGRAREITDPDDSKEGWVRTDDGAFAVGEPQGSPGWFPCNNALDDKATYDFRITVPRGLEAIANGSPVARKRKGARRTWVWRAEQPMASYLATTTVGQFELERSRFDGIESVVAVDPREAAEARRPLRKIPKIVRFYSSIFGPYPFTETGAIVDQAPNVGYALETQTRPVYHQAPGEATVAHELAHQWFGDSVSLETWPQMWLNEGFATWSEWRWAEQRGGRTTAEAFAQLERTPASENRTWDPPPAAIPDPSELFAGSVYERGGMALEALRQQIGDPAFYMTMRDWATQHAYANASIGEFIALAEANSGQELDPLFQRYLYQPGKP